MHESGKAAYVCKLYDVDSRPAPLLTSRESAFKTLLLCFLTCKMILQIIWSDPAVSFMTYKYFTEIEQITQQPFEAWSRPPQVISYRLEAHSLYHKELF